MNLLPAILPQEQPNKRECAQHLSSKVSENEERRNEHRSGQRCARYIKFGSAIQIQDTGSVSNEPQNVSLA